MAAAAQVAFCVRIVSVVLFLFSIPAILPPVRQGHPAKYGTSCPRARALWILRHLPH